MDSQGKSNMSEISKEDITDVYPYHVIQFINVGRQPKIKKVDIVVTKWLHYNALKKKCTVKYPPPPYTEEALKKYNDYLINLSDFEDHWISYGVIIKGRAKCLNEAFQKLDLLNQKETALTLESDENDVEAEKKAADLISRSQLLAASISMKDKILNESQISSNNYTSTSKKRKFLSNNRINVIDPQPQPSIASKKKQKIETLNKENDISDTLITILHEVKELKTDLCFIKNQLQQVQILQENISSTTQEEFCGNISQINNKYNFNIPFKNFDDFQNFDSALKQDEELSKDVNSVLKTAVDSSLSISRSIVNMLKLFISKNVAMQYVAIKKKKNKFIMKKTEFFNKIEVIIKHRRGLMGLETIDKELIRALSNVLCNAVSWYKSNSDDFNDLQNENNIESYNNIEPKVIATGTIKNGVLQLDQNSVRLSLADNNDTKKENASDSESFCSSYDEDYLENFAT